MTKENRRRQLAPIDVRAPMPLHAAIDAYARATGHSRSEAVRALLGRALELGGFWPPGPGTASAATAEGSTP